MSAPPVALRCTRCGKSALLPPPPGPATAWFGCPNCGHPIPVTPWRARPPLFTWEVFPHLYPALPPPRVPGPAGRSAVVALLVVGTLALAFLAGVLALEGTVALTPSTYTVAGEVERNAGGPIAGALVVLHAEGGPGRTALTSANGSFRFAGVPGGGVTLNATARGFGNTSVALFLSPVYSTQGTPSDPAVIGLSASNASANHTAPTVIVESPFPDLESFLTSVWSSSVLLGAAAAVAAGGTFALARRGRAGLGVVGGAAAATAPAAVFLLEVNAAFPWIGVAAGATIGLGAAVAGAQALRMASVGRPLEPE